MDDKKKVNFHHKDSDYQPKENYMSTRELEKNDTLKEDKKPLTLDEIKQREQEKRKPENLEFEDSYLLGYAPFDRD